VGLLSGLRPRAKLVVVLLEGMRMKKSEMAELIDKRAEELARSGKYSNALGVEYALKYEGYKNVRSALGDFRRRELDEICRQAQEQNDESDG
jgi:hypothetical protein